MNRQTKRLLQRQGQLAPDDAPAAAATSARPTAPPQLKPSGAERLPLPRRFANYLGEVRTELAKVLWPRRSEVVNYSAVVLTTLVLLALLIFGLNFLFAKGVLFLFKG